jgi:PAS domain S-box-containing protein
MKQMSAQQHEMKTVASVTSGPETDTAIWRQVLDEAPLGFALLDVDSTKTLWINRVFRSLLAFGTGLDEVIGLSPTEYLPNLDRDVWERGLHQEWGSQAEGQPLSGNRIQFVHHTTRNIAYWEWMLQRIVSMDETYLLLTLHGVSDIVMNERLLATAGRAAERARRHAEALVRLTQLVNASLTSPELLQAVTREAAVYFDTGYAAVLLLTPDRQHFTVGYSIGLHSDSVNQIVRLRRERTLAWRAISERRPLILTEPPKHDIDTPILANGSMPATLVSSPIIHQEHIYGAVEVYFAHVRDVNAEARALLGAFADQTAVALLKADLYQQIEEQHRQLQSIFDNAPVAIVYFDANGVAVTANAAAAARYGYAAPDMIGRPYSHYLREAPPDLFDRVRQGTPFHASHYVQPAAGGDPDGKEAISDLSLLPVRDSREQVVGLLLLSFDVTELVSAQQEAETARRAAVDALAEVRATQTQMVQMEKMRAVGELASGIAHDFNNALMAIMGYTELAEEDLDNPQALASHLGIIKKAAQDASSTVQRLQRFARQRVATHGVATDLNEVVHDVVEMTRPRWRDTAQKEGRTYEVQIVTAPLPPVMGEPSGLREVLVNMIYNAFDAMPEGGKLTLTTRLHGPDQVEVEVADTGIGMTPDIVQRIFDPFFTTRGVEGTGLGLAVSWTIIQRHGGVILVDSAPGRGTRFIVRIPIGQIETNADSVTPPQKQIGAESEINILIVDDEPIIAGVLRSILSRHGFRVTVAQNAREALERLRQEGMSFRMVLTDHGMPGMNGLQLVAETKRLYPDLPVLLLTGWGETVLQNHVAEALPDAVLGKPINQSDLLEVVIRMMNSRT